MAADIISRAEGRAKGLTKYFTGKPCKNHHIAERRVANGCCDLCYRDIERRCREQNREAYRAKWKRASAKARAIDPSRVEKNNRKWQRNNPEKVAARKKRYRTSNASKVRLSEKRYRDANPEKIQKKNKSYKTQHAERLAPIARERTKQWAKDNPEAVRRNINARRAREYNALGSHTVDQLHALLHSQDYLCIGCYADLREKSARSLDHIVALSRGGSQWIENIQYLCKPCNSRKHDKTQLEWLTATAERF